ncbi:carbamate kinase [Synergistales bacterium]|nr:carbamate kinase [Synergistales bacterium]
MGKVAVVAVGGNSLIIDEKKRTVEDQYAAIVTTAANISDMVEKGYDVVITHGNGPQVGFILRRSEIANQVAGMHHVPLVSCGADTQGAIGYQIQQAMDNQFKARGVDKKAVTVVTQVVVDRDDPAFKKPAKPIGSFYKEEQMEAIKKENPDWVMVEDAGRGFRRVVASPKPVEIVELEIIKLLIRQGYCLVAVGGGGIPVVRADSGMLEGRDAVIDKDFASALLASEIDADLLVISTGVPLVYINYGKPEQKALTQVTLSELKKYKEEGHFAPGSMLPKIEAVIGFLEQGEGRKAIITNPDSLGKAVDGHAGTHVIQG